MTIALRAMPGERGRLRLLRARDVEALSHDREFEIVELVRDTYRLFGSGSSDLPHSTFLGFPGHPENRVIALPAYLGGRHHTAGIKWIASFPGNIQRGLDRASAVIVLNDADTGRPHTVLEGSRVSAMRTAASAALAARVLRPALGSARVALAGCGPINFEILRFLHACGPELKSIAVHDAEPSRASAFAALAERRLGVTVQCCDEPESALEGAAILSLATNARAPHLRELSGCAPGVLVLHVSLRDLHPDLLLRCHNVVDDPDHVCRAGTSVHLAAEQVGHRDFLSAALPDLLLGRSQLDADDGRPLVFSPFGLGVLDLALAADLAARAAAEGRGEQLENFLPEPWADQILIEDPR